MFVFFFFKQKTAYEMRISDWSSDVCSSDLAERKAAAHFPVQVAADIILFFVEFVAAVKVHMTIEWFEVDGLAERCVAIDEGLQLRRRKAIAEQGIVRETVSVALGTGAAHGPCEIGRESELAPQPDRIATEPATACAKSGRARCRDRGGE